MVKNQKYRQVFICSEQSFPHGSAGANYILYLGKALMELGYQTRIIGFGTARKADYLEDEDKYMFEGLEYTSLQQAHPNCHPFLLYNLLGGKFAVEQLKKWELQPDDIVIIYSKNMEFIVPIMRLAKKVKNIKLAVCVVEWYGKEQFKGGMWSLEYWRYNIAFHFVIPKVKNVIAISRCLEEFFTGKGCNVLRLPILTDCQGVTEKKEKKREVQIIYSGSIGKKDEVGMILEALQLLNSEERKIMRFHFTGTSKKKLENYLGGSKLLAANSDILVFHEWLEYNDLVKLYSKMDFLMIARKESRFTRANFPSKIPETMRQGIIPIINQIGDYGQDYLQDNINSIFLNDCTAEACAAAIRKAISMREEKREEMSLAAIACAKDRFDYRGWEQKIENYFERRKALLKEEIV